MRGEWRGRGVSGSVPEVPLVAKGHVFLSGFDGQVDGWIGGWMNE